MEQNYTPKAPRLCPVCGSAVADGFDKCPTCGSAMPMAEQPVLNTPPQPEVPSFTPYEIPEGCTIVRDRKEYFEYYLPRQHYSNIILSAILTPIITLLLGIMILLGSANNVPVLFIAHTLIITALGLWMLAKVDLASSVTTLVYSCIFFLISLGAFDIAFWYPVVAAIFAVVSVNSGNKNWKAYSLSPIPLATVSDTEKKSLAKTKKIYRIVAIVLAVVLLAMGGVMVYQGIQEDKFYENYSTGEVSGNVYTNEFADITFTAPRGWVILSEEELKEYNETYKGYSYDIYTYATIFYVDNGKDENYEFMCIDVTQHERKELAEDYFDDVLNYNDGAEDMYGNIGSSEELDPVVIGGVEYRVMHTLYSGGSEGAYDEYILIRTLGALTYEIYFYPAGETSLSELLACFN